jgi:hypothetical protein
MALSLAGLDDEWQRGVAVLSRSPTGYQFDSSQGVLKNVLAPPGAGLSGSLSWECALLPFGSRLQAMKSALDYQLPCLGAFLTPHAGSLPPEGSFLTIGPEEALLSAMFVRSGKVYVRLWNASSEGIQASVGSGAPLSLWRCSLDLVDEARAEVSISLPPWGVQTLRLGGTDGS